MPESNTPGNFSGGNVTGTRMTEQKTPALPSQCQKGVPLRRPLTSACRAAANICQSSGDAWAH